MKTEIAADIVVVDDNQTNLYLFSKVLQGHGYAVRLAIDAPTALQSIMIRPPILLLIDINMPVMNGFQLCEKIKAEEKLKNIPIIFISSHITTEYKVEAFRLGAVDYITKPIINEELLARVDIHIKARKSVIEIEEANLRLLQLNEEIKADKFKLNELNHQLQAHLLGERNNRKALLNILLDQKSTLEILAKSESNYYDLFHNSPDMYFSVQVQTGKILQCNNTFIKMTGYSREELLNKKVIELYTDGTEKNYLTIIQKFINTGKVSNENLTVLRRDGGKIHVLLSATAIRDEDGTITCSRSIWRDITQIKKAEKVLQKLSRAIEQSPVSIIITDAKGLIEYVNPKVCEITGYDFGELIGANPRLFKSGEKSENEYKALWGTILSGREWKGEFHNRKKNGELYWESASISPVFDDTKKITHLIAVKEDITEKKQMISQLIVAKEKAEEMNRIKSSFFANMSHELRTPLIGILGFAELLRDDLEGMTQYTQMAEIIFKSGQRLLETINQILNISKLEAGKLTVNKQLQDIIPLIEDVTELFSISAMKKGLKLQVEFSELAVLLYVDKFLFKSIMSNLIGNAIKYTIEGTINVRVKVVRNNCEINVTDTGIGIAKQDQNFIWDEFRQISEGFSRGYEGTGLGLTLVKKYTEIMGGSIHLQSEEGKGATFTVLLPC